MVSESAIQSQTRAQFGFVGPIWRNNSGVLPDRNGRPVRYGLSNDSKELNRKTKSSDLIGITPVLITPDMFGAILGVFTALECKPSGWAYRENDKRAAAQLKYHEIVRQAGGYAGFVSDPAQINEIIKRG